MPSVKVCTVIVTYNGIKWIEKCLNSIINSTIESDVLVVDNGSTDGTFEYLEKDGGCKFLYQSNENLGFGKANNLALQQGYSEGYEYFLLLNQDAWIEENVIEQLMLRMQSETQYGISSPLHYNGSGTTLDTLFESYLSRMDSYQRDLKSNAVRNGLYESKFINAACWMLNRNTLKEVGLFHPLFEHYGEDDNYIDRLHHHGLLLGLDPEVKMYHDRDGTGINHLKNDPARLFRRTMLRDMLDPSNRGPWSQAFKKARRISKKLSKQLPLLPKWTFRTQCLIEYIYLSRDVRRFEKNRQQELNID